jgi:hypothetical protein
MKMAKGEICPRCGYYMFASEEKEHAQGSWIVYECRNENCKFRMKTFEDKVTFGNFDKAETSVVKSNDLSKRFYM